MKNENIKLHKADLIEATENKAQSYKEEKRLRSERVKLSGIISAKKTELEKLKAKRESMQGLTAGNLQSSSEQITALEIELKNINDSVGLIGKAMEKEILDRRDMVVIENGARQSLGGALLRSKTEDMQKAMDALLPLWALASTAAERNHFDDPTYFARWMEAQFWTYLKPNIQHDGYLQHFETELKKGLNQH